MYGLGRDRASLDVQRGRACRLRHRVGHDAPGGDFSFAQISDCHIGFDKAPNQDVTATFQQAVDHISALPIQPAFLLHTGDLTYLSKADEFDTVAQLLSQARARQVFYVPGEHDVIGDDGKAYLEMCRPRSSAAHWA